MVIVFISYIILYFQFPIHLFFNYYIITYYFLPCFHVSFSHRHQLLYLIKHSGDLEWLRAFLHGGGGPQVDEVTCGG